MKLLLSPTFTRLAKKLIKKHPDLADNLRNALRLLETDLFHPKLRTHNLKGSLSGSMACSVSYDLRIVFAIVADNGEEKILLQTIGTHDEVY